MTETEKTLTLEDLKVAAMLLKKNRVAPVVDQDGKEWYVYEASFDGTTKVKGRISLDGEEWYIETPQIEMPNPELVQIYERAIDD